eukprot:COSAG05_NODE_13173_length_439_cov_0.885294_1_plen_99_part_01
MCVCRFQWVTQTADAPQGALTASGEVRKLRRLHVGNLPANVASEGGDELLSAAIWNELKARAMPLTGAEPHLRVTSLPQMSSPVAQVASIQTPFFRYG